MSDHIAKVYTITADDAVASNGLNFGLLVHKVVLLGVTANECTLSLHDQATVTGTPEITLKTSITGDTEYNQYVEADFNPPMYFKQMSADIGGTNAIAKVYYTRK
jgi:hypothetical protein